MPRRFGCLPCGHLYDPAEGAPTSHIPPGTAFQPLSD
ncbi:rubredoxin [Pyxidicoccus sp. MSG2]|nr:rubredoxin [Pyxidicoccus sp. MSG2]MCY1014600.1 rubredoxin [Pyxidicoccus sp. MSG2]